MHPFSLGLQIFRFNNSKAKPEFANVIRQGKAIIPLDILPLQMAGMEKASKILNVAGTSIDFKVESQQDTNVTMALPADIWSNTAITNDNTG